MSVLILRNRFCGLTLVFSKPVRVCLGLAQLVHPSFNVRNTGNHKSTSEISKSSVWAFSISSAFFILHMMQKACSVVLKVVEDVLKKVWCVLAKLGVSLVPEFSWTPLWSLKQNDLLLSGQICSAFLFGVYEGLYCWDFFSVFKWCIACYHACSRDHWKTWLGWYLPILRKTVLWPHSSFGFI